MKTLYQYVVDLRDRVEETCKMAKVELAKVQVRNQKYYNKTYHINMLKRYYHRESPTDPTFNGSKASSNSDDNDVMNMNQDVDHQAASVACVIEEEVSDEAMSGKDVEALPLYNIRQETVDDVIVNSQLSAEQKNQVKDLPVEYKEIFSDVPKVTHLIEHKVELTPFLPRDAMHPRY